MKWGSSICYVSSVAGFEPAPILGAYGVSCVAASHHAALHPHKPHVCLCMLVVLLQKDGVDRAHEGGCQGIHGLCVRVWPSELLRACFPNGL